MPTYAKVTIKQYIDSPELDMLDYIAQHGEPSSHKMVRLWIVDEIVHNSQPLRSEFGTLAGGFYFSQVKEMHLKPAYSLHGVRWTINGRTVIVPPDAERYQVLDQPVPRPKSRVPLEWQNGRWVKYLKTRGWVPA